MKKLLVLNGPNLNKLGEREPALYGSQTLKDLEQMLEEALPDLEFRFVQSNHEGVLIDALQQAKEDGIDGVIANFGGFSHSSVAILDALKGLDLPKVEVHMTHVHAREPFRERSLTAQGMDGMISGFGADSYLLGVLAVQSISEKRLREAEQAPEGDEQA